MKHFLALSALALTALCFVGFAAAHSLAAAHPPAAPTGVMVHSAGEGVLVSWDQNEAAAHWVAWMNDDEYQAAKDAGDWTTALRYASVPAGDTHVVPAARLIKDADYWFAVGSESRQTPAATSWGAWQSVTAIVDDRITASEVTDRPTLRAFVEGAKDYLESVTTVTGIARLRDAFRSEGPWKSGSLFLTTLTQNGNILIHGDDPTSENKRVVAVEDELGRPVGQELLAAAERGGDFVDYRWDGTDRVAYAVQYASGLTANTLMVVGGFAQDLTSVPVEFTPLPRPEVTAAEVVDRETLATFVNAAAKAYLEATLSPNLSGLGNTKTAFRQEGGDWKSGSVYVFVASTDGYTLFHGAFPVRFEGRQFEDIDRQDANGVLYIREVLAAGEAGGGFVEYLFDNPVVEGDEETGSRKIAYATGFRLPGQDQVFVVGSGFYPDD